MILENVKVQWAKLGKDNAGTKYMSDEKEWSVDIILNDEQATKWKETNVFPKVKEKDGKQIVTLRKDVMFKDKLQTSPAVYDKFGKPLDVLIGNDSTVNIQFSLGKEWDFKGMKGQSARLVAVQVLDLVEYEGAGGVEFTFDEEPLAEMTELDDHVPF